MPVPHGSGPANVYPSSLGVPTGATIEDVDVVLNDISGTSQSDLDILLVGPGGQQALVMSDVGGFGVTRTDMDLTLDDAAASDLPSTATLVSGTYRPTNGGTVPDTFADPAPEVAGTSALSVFGNGTTAAGEWKLYVMDDAPAGDGHTIGSWGLRFKLATAPLPSTVSVSGLPVVTDVNVGLHGLTTGSMDDVDLLLVGPDGNQAVILSDAGGAHSVSDLDLTIDDQATSAPSDDGLVASGAYKPFNYVGADQFPAAPQPQGFSTLAVFRHTDPNGEGRLFAEDDTSGNLSVLDGWSLDFSWDDTSRPSGSVTIDGGAAATSSRSVTLKLDATDPAPASGVAQMRFSNDGQTFSAYQPYSASATWVLGDTKTVSHSSRTLTATSRPWSATRSCCTCRWRTRARSRPPPPSRARPRTPRAPGPGP